MKKAQSILVILILILAVVSIAYAASIPSYGQDPSYTQKFNLLSTTSGTAAGSVVQLGKPFRSITCLLTNPSGSTATSAYWRISGGIDSSNIVTLTTITSTSFPALQTTNTATAYDILFVRGQIVSKATPTDDTANYRIDCVASH